MSKQKPILSKRQAVKRLEEIEQNLPDAINLVKNQVPRLDDKNKKALSDWEAEERKKLELKAQRNIEFMYQKDIGLYVGIVVGLIIVIITLLGDIFSFFWGTIWGKGAALILALVCLLWLGSSMFKKRFLVP